MSHPEALTTIIIITSWMSYRMLGFRMLTWVEAHGGDTYPTAWVIPLDLLQK